MNNLKTIKKSILITLIFLMLLLIMINNNNKINENVQQFCESIKINDNVNAIKVIDDIKIVYSDSNFIEYDQKKSLNPFINKTYICMLEIKDGKVISKKLKSLH